MKEQYDKRTKNAKFSVGDTVMLWKPYKHKGLSGCFQPHWDGPWSIVKFTGKRKMNCKIIRCGDSTQKLNVHINQLKIVQENEFNTEFDNEYNDTQNNNQTIIDTTNDTETKRRGVPDMFLDYIDDFDEIDNRFVVNNNDNNIVEQDGLHPNEPIPAVRQQIDQRWVSVDASNIIPGDRTRGVRRDYSEFR